MYSGGSTTLPATGVGAAAAMSAFAGYTVAAIVLGIIAVLCIAGGSLLMRVSR